MKILAVAVAMALFQLVSLTIVISDDNNVCLRFEELLQMAGFSAAFIIAGVLTLGIIALSFYKNWIDSKSIYALLGLPGSREMTYFAKLTAAVLSVLALITVQLANVIISYGYYHTFFPDIPKVRNGLFLSFIRSDFLSMFYPSGLVELLTAFAFIIALPAIVIFLVSAERSRQRKTAVFVILGVIITLLVPLPLNGLINWVLVLILTVALSVKLFKEGSVA